MKMTLVKIMRTMTVVTAIGGAAIVYILPGFAENNDHQSEYSVGVFYSSRMREAYPNGQDIIVKGKIPKNDFQAVTNQPNVFKARFNTVEWHVDKLDSVSKMGFELKNDGAESRYEIEIRSESSSKNEMLTVYVIGPNHNQLDALSFEATRKLSSLSENGEFDEFSKYNWTMGSSHPITIEFACQETTVKPPCLKLNFDPNMGNQTASSSPTPMPEATPTAFSAITVPENGDMRSANFGELGVSFIPADKKTPNKNIVWVFPYQQPLEDQEKTNCFQVRIPFGVLYTDDIKENTLTMNDFFRPVTVRITEDKTMVTLIYQATQGERRVFWQESSTEADQTLSLHVPRVSAQDAQTWKWNVARQNCKPQDMPFAHNKDELTIPACQDTNPLKDWTIQTEPGAFIRLRKGDDDDCDIDAMAVQDGKMNFGKHLNAKEPLTVIMTKPGFVQQQLTVEFKANKIRVKENVKENNVALDQDNKILTVHLRPIGNIPPKKLSLSDKRTQMNIKIGEDENKLFFNGSVGNVQFVPEGSGKYQLSKPSNDDVFYEWQSFGSDMNIVIPDHPDARRMTVQVSLTTKDNTPLTNTKRARFKGDGEEIQTSQIQIVGNKFQFKDWFWYDTAQKFQSKKLIACYAGCERFEGNIPAALAKELILMSPIPLNCPAPIVHVVISGNESSEQSNDQKKYWMIGREALLEKWENYTTMRIFSSGQGRIKERKTKNELSQFFAASTDTNFDADREIEQAVKFNGRQQDPCGNWYPDADVVYIAKNPGLKLTPEAYRLHLISPDTQPSDLKAGYDWKTCSDAAAIQEAIEKIKKGDLQ